MAKNDFMRGVWERTAAKAGCSVEELKRRLDTATTASIERMAIERGVTVEVMQRHLNASVKLLNCGPKCMNVVEFNVLCDTGNVPASCADHVKTCATCTAVVDTLKGA